MYHHHHLYKITIVMLLKIIKVEFLIIHKIDNKIIMFHRKDKHFISFLMKSKRDPVQDYNLFLITLQHHSQRHSKQKLIKTNKT